MPHPGPDDKPPFDLGSLRAPLSRRSLLRGGAGLVGLGMVPALIACGDDDDGGGSSSSSSTSAADTKVGGTLNYLGWEGEDYPKVLKKFKTANDITIKSSYIASMSDIPAKFAAGGGKGLDVVDFSAPGTIRLQQSGVELIPLDLERIPNWKNVEQFIEYTGKTGYSNLDGEIIGAPICWGALGITYDASAISEPKAWADLSKPEFKGKITTVDDPSSNICLAAQILGYKSDQMTKAQLDDVTEYLTGIVANCKKLSPSYGDITNLFVSGEITACFAGWTAINVFALGGGKKTIKTNLTPEEGSALFVEMWTLAKDAQNTGTAYALINELLDPKVNAAAADSVVSGATVTGAPELQDKSVASLYPAPDDYASYFETSKVAIDPPAESDEFVTFGEATEAWTQIKAAAA